MKYVIFTAAFIIFLQSVQKGQNSQKDSISAIKSSKEGKMVSLLKVIANPKNYDGKRVRIVGFLNINFESDALYSHKEDYLHSITRNAVSVHISMRLRTMTNVDICNKKYVIIEGTFDAKDYGHENLFEGALKDVTLLKLWHPTKKDK
jgi:hypothetical protein